MLSALSSPPASAYDDLDDVEGDVIGQRELAGLEDGADIALPDGVDQEWLLAELWKDLLRGEQAKAVLAEAEMRRVIEFNRSIGAHRTVDGLGQLVARVPLSVYHHWTTRYGTEFWQQQDSLDYIAARNPGFLVETKAPTTVIVDGFRDQHFPAASSVPVAHGEKAAAGMVPAAVSSLPTGRRGRWAR